MQVNLPCSEKLVLEKLVEAQRSLTRRGVMICIVEAEHWFLLFGSVVCYSLVSARVPKFVREICLQDN